MLEIQAVGQMLNISRKKRSPCIVLILATQFLIAMMMISMKISLRPIRTLPGWAVASGGEIHTNGFRSDWSSYDVALIHINDL